MSQTTPKDILSYVLAYVLWLVNVAVCTVVVIEFRSTVNVFWVMTGHSRWTLGLADQICIMLGGLVALVYVVFLESYYRHSITQPSQKPETRHDVSPPGRAVQSLNKRGLFALLRRFAWTTAIPIGLLLVSLALRPIAFSVPH